jgi:LPS export ABC transporter protein LptC
VVSKTKIRLTNHVLLILTTTQMFSKLNKSFFTCTAVAFAMLLFSCENDINTVNKIALKNQSEQAIESSKDVEFLYSDSAQIKMKLNSPQIDRFVTQENAHFEMPQGMHMCFYGKYPAIQSKLEAGFGIGTENSNGIMQMEVRRKVIVINEKGDKLTTEKLIWDAVKKQIYTDEFVTITTQKEVIWGDGLIANEDFSEYEITNIKGQLNVNNLD